MRTPKTTVLTIAAALLVCNIASADIINFESGFVDQQQVTSVATPSNVVTFSVTGGDGMAYIASPGGPQTSFVPNDNTTNPATTGNFFLNDEFNGPNAAGDYIMDFANPITSLSLDLYDFRGDGGNADQVTLTLYDAANAVVGSDIFNVVGGLPDGNIVNLSALASSPAIRAELTFNNNGDVGTGIDNIQFATVPEPAAIGLWLLLAAAAVGVTRIRRRTMQPCRVVANS